MTLDHHVEDSPRPARPAVWGALAVAVTGAVLFGGVVAGVGDWVEGRQLGTVGPWAVPGLVLAIVAGAAAVHALQTGRGRRTTFLLALAVVSSVALLLLLNPAIAPPVP